MYWLQHFFNVKYPVFSKSVIFLCLTAVVGRSTSCMNCNDFAHPQRRSQCCFFHHHWLIVHLSRGYPGTMLLWDVFSAATCLLISFQVNSTLWWWQTNTHLLVHTGWTAKRKMFPFLQLKRLISVPVSMHILTALLHVCPFNCAIYSSPCDSLLKLQTFLNDSGCALNYSYKTAICNILGHQSMY